MSYPIVRSVKILSGRRTDISHGLDSVRHPVAKSRRGRNVSHPPRALKCYKSNLMWCAGAFPKNVPRRCAVYMRLKVKLLRTLLVYVGRCHQPKSSSRYLALWLAQYCHASPLTIVKHSRVTCMRCFLVNALMTSFAVTRKRLCSRSAVTNPFGPFTVVGSSSSILGVIRSFKESFPALSIPATRWLCLLCTDCGAPSSTFFPQASRPRSFLSDTRLAVMNENGRPFAGRDFRRIRAVERAMVADWTQFVVRQAGCGSNLA